MHGSSATWAVSSALLELPHQKPQLSRARWAAAAHVWHFPACFGFYPVMYSYLQVCKYAVAFFSRGIQTFTCDVLNSFVLGRWEEGSGATEVMILSDGLNADLRCRTSDGVLLKSESWLCHGIVLWPQERQVHFLSDFLHVRKGGQDIFRAVLDKCCEDWMLAWYFEKIGEVFWKCFADTDSVIHVHEDSLVC